LSFSLSDILIQLTWAVFAAGAAVHYLTRHRLTLAVWRNIRWLRIGHYAFMIALGALFQHDHSGFRSFSDIAWPMAGMFLSLFSAALIATNHNDTADVDADAVSNPQRPLVSGKVTVLELRRVNRWLWPFALAGSALITPWLALFPLVAIGLYAAYSLPPLRLKRLPVLAHILIGADSAWCILWGFSACPGPHDALPWRYMILALAVFSIGFHVKDLKDISGDRAAGVPTLATLLPEPWNRVLIALLSASCFPLVMLILGRSDMAGWIGAAVGAPISFFLISRPTYRERLLFGLYFAYAAVLLATKYCLN